MRDVITGEPTRALFRKIKKEEQEEFLKESLEVLFGKEKKMRDIQIGGNYTCSKCGQYCSGAVLHICPEEKKQRKIGDFDESDMITVTCPTCKKKRKVIERLHNRQFFGDPNICDECRKSSGGIYWSNVDTIMKKKKIKPDKYNQFFIDTQKALKKIEKGKSKSYVGKYNGKKGKIQITIKRTEKKDER